MLPEGKALPALFHDEGADAPGANAGGGDGKDHIGVRLAAVGDENLFAVEDVVIPLEHCGGLRAAGVRTGVGLGEAKGANLLTLGQGHQVLLLLLLGAKGINRPGTQGHVGGENHACAAVHPGELLHSNGIAGGVQPCAAVLRGEWDTHQSHFRQTVYHFPAGEVVFLIPLEGIRLDFRLGIGPDLCAQRFMLLGRLEVHTVSSSHQ